MTVKPPPKPPRKDSESKWPESQLHWLMPHQRAVPERLKDLLKTLPSELSRSFATLHELVEKQTQAEMVCAYQVGMIVRFLLDRSAGKTELQDLSDHFVALTKALGVKSQYLEQACELVDAYSLPEFGALIRQSTMTWHQLSRLVMVEARIARRNSASQCRRPGGAQ